MTLTFEEIIEKIKDIICHEVKGKVFDRHVAEVLGLDYAALRVYKVKNYIPVNKLVKFCLKRGISIDWLLTDPDPFLPEVRERLDKIMSRD